MGKDLWLMVSLVIISTIDLDDWMPGSRAPGLFVFAALNSREKERGQGVGTLFSLDNATYQNFLFMQYHCESRLNLAGMLSQLEYLGTMSSLHKMVNFILKMTLHMVSFAIFRAFCYILASKVLKIAHEIQT